MVAGALLAQRRRGDRVVVLWMTRGEMTEALGRRDPEAVAERRTELGLRAAEVLDVEPRFLDLPDTAVEPSPQGARRVARVLADVAPDGLLTWGRAWVRGLRHPDHEATGKLARDAVTLARIARVVEPLEPHRAPCPVFTVRGAHSSLPTAAVDVSTHREQILEVAALYREALGFGDPEWLLERLGDAGSRWGVDLAEEYDTWETAEGLMSALLPADPGRHRRHPERRPPVGRQT